MAAKSNSMTLFEEEEEKNTKNMVTLYIYKLEKTHNLKYSI